MRTQKKDHVESIKQEIEAAIQELEQIKSRGSKILCAEELEKFEKKGEKDASSLPVIEGTMKGPDAVFGLIKYYLKQLAITKAEKVLFVADGARWIWNRVPEWSKYPFMFKNPQGFS